MNCLVWCSAMPYSIVAFSIKDSQMDRDFLSRKTRRHKVQGCILHATLDYRYVPPNARKERRMFLCKILMGLYTVSKVTEVVPPVNDPDNSKTDPSCHHVR